MGLNKSYKPSMCRNIGKNDENVEEMVQSLGFFRDFAKWRGMAIFYLDLKKKLQEQLTIGAQLMGQ